jgi:L,D-transpeptidase catalytic domain/Putative peptidoglycan binding domain/PKD domain
MRVVVAVFALLALAPAANAACPVKVSPSRGAAPLRVTFHAACGTGTYRWRFGDGKVGRGRTVTHAYPGGRFTPTLTTRDGTRKLPPVTSVALSFVAPRKADYGERVTLHARAKPKLPVRLGGHLFRHGRLTITVTHPFLTAVAGPAVVRKAIVVKPRLDVRLAGSRTIGSPLQVAAILRPAHAGTVAVSVDGTRSTRVKTSSVHIARIVVLSTPKPGWAAVSRVVRARINAPSLSRGATGPGVLALERRLRELHYALQGTDGVFGEDDEEAVLAFQKVYGLERTGAVTPGLWRLLARAGVPKARYPGDHVEVDKTRQVLFLVRAGEVALVTHVSTGATGNTPVGLWHVYSKVVGWSWVLWYPSYFLRGFAIHGYPEVPAYPASHGCVRVPMWLAPKLFTQIPLGGAVYVYA